MTLTDDLSADLLMLSLVCQTSQFCVQNSFRSVSFVLLVWSDSASPVTRVLKNKYSLCTMLKRGNSVTDMCDSETVMDAIHPRFLEKPIVVYRGTVLSKIIN